MNYVLIVEDERLANEVLVRYIEEASDRYCLVDSIKSADDALVVCKHRKVDMVLMDICTADNASGLVAAKLIKEELSKIKVIIMTSMPEYSFINKARDARVDSFWYKDGSEDIVNVMDRTMAGESVYPNGTPVIKIGNVTSDEFTERELELLYQLVKYSNTKKIAENMNITNETVRTYIKRLLSKTGCSSKTELALMVVESRLILPKF